MCGCVYLSSYTHDNYRMKFKKKLEKFCHQKWQGAVEFEKKGMVMITTCKEEGTMARLGKRINSHFLQ